MNLINAPSIYFTKKNITVQAIYKIGCKPKWHKFSTTGELIVTDDSATLNYWHIQRLPEPQKPQEIVVDPAGINPVVLSGRSVPAAATQGSLPPNRRAAGNRTYFISEEQDHHQRSRHLLDTLEEVWSIDYIRLRNTCNGLKSVVTSKPPSRRPFS